MSKQPFVGLLAPGGAWRKKVPNKSLVVANDKKAPAITQLEKLAEEYPPWCGEMAGTNAMLLKEKQELEYWEIRGKRIAAQRKAMLDEVDVDNLTALKNGDGGVMPTK
jgi:hypothetical protein